MEIRVISYHWLLIMTGVLLQSEDSLPLKSSIARLSSTPTRAPSPPSPDDYEDINSMGRKTEIFSKILDEAGYDTKLRPPGVNGTGPTVVQVSLHIR